ncbi:MAG TPA: hypothetical protein VFA43_03745 [Gemmatimonadaceae bacterium]|nr:hypothetical protein [Gemmatimonadaceae bacterium]
MPGDSLDAVEFFMDLERDFNVDISESSAERIGPSISVGEMYGIIAGTDVRPEPGDPTWRRLVLYVAKYMAVPADDVGWDTRPFS